MSFKQVDVSSKEVVLREAVATGRIRLKKKTIARIKAGTLEKGDALSIAALTAVLGAKKTPELVALAHPLHVEKTEPTVKIGGGWISVTVTVRAHDRTGVEMEALTAVMVSLLNIWDVVKQYEKDSHGQYPTTVIDSIQVVKKSKRGS